MLTQGFVREPSYVCSVAKEVLHRVISPHLSPRHVPNQHNVVEMAATMNYQRLANGLYVPLLPERCWNNEAILVTREGYSAEDAFKILKYLSSQYLNEVDTVLFRVVDLCDEVEIEFVTEGHRLCLLFDHCPECPLLQPLPTKDPQKFRNIIFFFDS